MAFENRNESFEQFYEKPTFKHYDRLRIDVNSKLSQHAYTSDQNSTTQIKRTQNSEIFFSSFKNVLYYYFIEFEYSDSVI